MSIKTTEERVPKKLMNLFLRRNVDAIQALLLETLELLPNNNECVDEAIDMFENMQKLSESIQNWKNKDSVIFTD